MTRISLTAEDRKILAQARRERGIRIKTLARALSVSPGAINHWLIGERSIPAEKLAIFLKMVLGQP